MPLQEFPPTDVFTFEGKELKLKEVDQNRFIIKYTVEKNCQLKEFIKSLGLAYRKGCVYYEFIHEETVSKDKELIFMPEVCIITLLKVVSDYHSMYCRVHANIIA